MEIRSYFMKSLIMVVNLSVPVNILALEKSLNFVLVPGWEAVSETMTLDVFKVLETYVHT